MSRSDAVPPTPEMVAALEAIDATLRGEPVAPEHADVAELALLLAAQRESPSPEFVHELDGRVDARFGEARTIAPPPAPPRSRRWARWWPAPVAGLAIAGLVALFVIAPGANNGSSSGSSAALSSSSPHGFGTEPFLTQRATHAAGRAKPSPGLEVPPSERRLIQSSQLTLGAAPRHIETVAQEALDVVGAHNGFVSSATVNATGGAGGYARLELTVPSATLPQTMTALSRLAHASVLTRTDRIEDVTGQLKSAKRHHQTARVRALEQGVAYSKISVDVRAEVPSSVTHHQARGGGFTIGAAASDALSVLTVVGGILLIALAVLVPLAAAATVAWQIWGSIRRRQRERALDLA